jgi:hypothetical protein
MMAAN